MPAISEARVLNWGFIWSSEARVDGGKPPRAASGLLRLRLGRALVAGDVELAAEFRAADLFVVRGDWLTRGQFGVCCCEFTELVERGVDECETGCNRDECR